MTGTITLIAALLFVAIALCRLLAAPSPRLRHAGLGLALAATLFGFVTFRTSGDSRWLVGAILMIGAAVPGWVAGRRHALATVAMICGMLGTALFGIAAVRPMAPPASSASRAG